MEPPNSLVRKHSSRNSTIGFHREIPPGDSTRGFHYGIPLRDSTTGFHYGIPLRDSTTGFQKDVTSMVVYVEIVPRSYRETSDTFQEIFREFHVLPK